MSRAMVEGKVITWIIALLAMVGFLWIVFNPELFSSIKQVTDIGCPKGAQVTAPCPCNGIRIASGYCCDAGPSDVPCFCSDESIKKCSDYNQDRCKTDPCKLGCGKIVNANGVCA